MTESECEIGGRERMGEDAMDICHPDEAIGGRN
jgi:hypothetical protein